MARGRNGTHTSAKGVIVHRGSLATVYCCPHADCAKRPVEGESMITVRRLPRGSGVGRGFGLATGGSAHAKIMAHMRDKHKEGN